MYTAARWQPPRALRSAEAWLILGPLLLGFCTKLQTKLLRNLKEKKEIENQMKNHMQFLKKWDILRVYMCVSEKDKISYHFTFSN